VWCRSSSGQMDDPGGWPVGSAGLCGDAGEHG
jgi:hypothetical protein